MNSSYSPFLRPSHDWQRIRAAATLALFVVVVWSGWVYMKVRGGEALGEASGSFLTPFSRSSLDTIRGLFTERALKEQKYRVGTDRFEDPSR